MLRVKLSDITRMSELTAATTLNGSTLTSLGNGQLLDNGLLPLTDVYTITLTSDSPEPITGIFLDAIKDPTNGLPDGGPGRWYGNSGTENNPSGVGLGNFVVSELTAAVSPGPPYMSDVVTNHSLTTLSGRAEADSTVSVFDGNKLLGTATADNFGDWSLQANIKGNPIHQFSETLTDAAGNSAASAGVTVYSPNQHQTLALLWQ